MRIKRLNKMVAETGPLYLSKRNSMAEQSLQLRTGAELGDSPAALALWADWRAKSTAAHVCDWV